MSILDSLPAILTAYQPNPFFPEYQPTAPSPFDTTPTPVIDLPIDTIFYAYEDTVYGCPYGYYKIIDRDEEYGYVRCEISADGAYFHATNWIWAASLKGVHLLPNSNTPESQDQI